MPGDFVGLRQPVRILGGLRRAYREGWTAGLYITKRVEIKLNNW